MGLNYGTSFKRSGMKKKGQIDWRDKDGVFYANNINAWIVRFEKKTMAKFDTEEEAVKFYESQDTDNPITLK